MKEIKTRIAVSEAELGKISAAHSNPTEANLKGTFKLLLDLSLLNLLSLLLIVHKYISLIAIVSFASPLNSANR